LWYLLQDQQQTRQRQLAMDEKQCRSYLTLATETVDMIPTLLCVQFFLCRMDGLIGLGLRKLEYPEKTTNLP
jgi:hypothetical protein